MHHNNLNSKVFFGFVLGSLFLYLSPSWATKTRGKNVVNEESSSPEVDAAAALLSVGDACEEEGSAAHSPAKRARTKQSAGEVLQPLGQDTKAGAVEPSELAQLNTAWKLYTGFGGTQDIGQAMLLFHTLAEKDVEGSRALYSQICSVEASKYIAPQAKITPPPLKARVRVRKPKVSAPKKATSLAFKVGLPKGWAYEAPAATVASASPAPLPIVLTPLPKASVLAPQAPFPLPPLPLPFKPFLPVLAPMAKGTAPVAAVNPSTPAAIFPAQINAESNALSAIALTPAPAISEVSAAPPSTTSKRVRAPKRKR